MRGNEEQTIFACAHGQTIDNCADRAELNRPPLIECVSAAFLLHSLSPIIIASVWATVCTRLSGQSVNNCLDDGFVYPHSSLTSTISTLPYSTVDPSSFLHASLPLNCTPFIAPLLSL